MKFRLKCLLDIAAYTSLHGTRAFCYDLIRGMQALNIVVQETQEGSLQCTMIQKDKGLGISTCLKHVCSAAVGAGGKAGVSKGRELATTSSKPAAPVGQVVELRFRAPRQGKYDLTLYVISGIPPPPSWLLAEGCPANSAKTRSCLPPSSQSAG